MAAAAAGLACPAVVGPFVGAVASIGVAGVGTVEVQLVCEIGLVLPF